MTSSTPPEAPPSRERLVPFFAAVESVVVGRRKLVERLMMGLLTDGHILLEGVPGLAKTLSVRTVASALDLTFRRIQFTPDLLPADVIGTQIYNPRSGNFRIKKGPVFANVVLADEINRAPAKVQSALLEAMEERQVTIGTRSYELPKPFIVLATQNPIEQEGTYPLPEAQVDRFMMKVVLDYPSKSEELSMLERMEGINSFIHVAAQIGGEELLAMRREVDQVHVDPKIRQYVVDIVRATRTPEEYGLDAKALIQVGGSPRATLALLRVAKAAAYLVGRDYATPDDVKSAASDVLRHRVVISYEAEAEELNSSEIIRRILDHLPVP